MCRRIVTGTGKPTETFNGEDRRLRETSNNRRTVEESIAAKALS